MILQNWWYTTLLDTAEPVLPFLEGDIACDVVIVGAGAAGLSAAMALMDSGLKVVLLDRNICGGSSTGKSAGFLTPDSELELAQLVRRYGEQGAKDTWECAQKGIERMVSLVNEHGLSCDLLKQDSLFLGNGSSGLNDVKEEVASRKQLGYEVDLYQANEIPKVLGATCFSGAVRYPGTYGIDALRYAQGLKKVLLEKGVKIFEATEVKRIEGHRVVTHAGSVTADQIILCADKPVKDLTRFQDEVYHALTFLSISEPLSDEEVKQLFPAEPMQCWDSDLVYSYWRLTGDQRILLGGGSALSTFSHNDVTSPSIIEGVIKRFKKRFPYLDDVTFLQYWPGRIDCTRDLMPTVVRDSQAPWIHVVLGCVGLPWATFCGDFAARHVLNTEAQDDHKFYRYFTDDRAFLIPTWAEKIAGKQLVFSLNNVWAKYYQVDQGHDPEYRKGQF